MLTGYAAVIGMIKAAMIDEAIGRGSSRASRPSPFSCAAEKLRSANAQR